MPSSAEQFARLRYVVARVLVQPREVAFLAGHALRRAAEEPDRDDHQVPATPSFYGDPLMEMFLEQLRPKIEQITGLELHPTYAYFRCYKQGDRLARHTDRPACEISVSLSLKAEPVAWPLCIEGPQGAASVELGPGDALLYRGRECPHWREEFTGTSAVQVFFHYVDRNGPHAEWRFDKRPALARLAS